MADATFTIVDRVSLGNKVLVVISVSAGADIAASAVGLSAMEYGWLQDVGDNAGLYITMTSRASWSLSAAPSGGNQLVFIVGY